MTPHINKPEPEEANLSRLVCPTCERRTRNLLTFFPWYGWRRVCLSCGESWDDGERCPRPFERGWRARRVAGAWKEAAMLGLLVVDAVRVVRGGRPLP